MTSNIAQDAGAASEDELVVAAKYGFARLNQSTGTLSYIREVWTERDEREKAERSEFYDTKSFRLISNRRKIIGCASMTAQSIAMAVSGQGP